MMRNGEIINTRNEQTLLFPPKIIQLLVSICLFAEILVVHGTQGMKEIVPDQIFSRTPEFCP